MIRLLWLLIWFVELFHINRPFAVNSHVSQTLLYWIAKILIRTSKQRNAKPEWLRLFCFLAVFYHVTICCKRPITDITHKKFCTLRQ